MSTPDATGLRCLACGARTPTEHPAVGGGGEVTTLCDDPYHRSTQQGRDTYEKAKNFLRARNLTVMRPGDNVAETIAREAASRTVAELPTIRTLEHRVTKVELSDDGKTVRMTLEIHLP